jgi:hypothetical protein
MKAAELKALAGGTILKIVDDGGHKAGHGCKFCKLNKPAHTAEVIVEGEVHTISIERLVKNA